MRVFAKFIGEDSDLEPGQVYIIRVDDDGYSAEGIRVFVGGNYEYNYNGYYDFTQNWEIIK